MAAFQDLTRYFIFLLLLATLGPLLFGFHLAELNAPQEVITCAKKSIQPDTPISRLADSVRSHFHGTATAADVSKLPQCIPMSPNQFGTVSSMFTLGGLIGALAAGPITGRQGRIRTMLYAAVMASIGPAFEALAPNVGVLAFGRFLSGLGAGATMVVVPIYISDIAPPGQKGFFGSFTQVMVNGGILVTQVLGYFFSRGQWWRVILGVGGVISVVQAAGLLLGGQESPKYLADTGKGARAKRVLRKLRGHAADVDAEVEGWGLESEQDLESEEATLLAGEDSPSGDSDEPRKVSQSVKREAMSVFAVMRDRDSAPAVFAVTMVMLAQQLTGINSIVMYGVALLSDLLAANSALLNVAVSALNVFMTAAAAPLVDKLGRKTCLLLSIAGMGTNSVLLAVGIMRGISVLSAVATLLFVASFALGLGPVPYILSSELVPPEAIAATQSWALAMNWIATFSVAQFFPILNAAMGKGRVYFIFAGFALLFGAFVAWWVPETKGKSDVDEVWGRKKSPARED